MTGAGNDAAKSGSGHDAAVPAAAVAGRQRGGRRQVVLSLVLLGAAAVATAAPTWLTTQASTVLDDSVTVVVTGTQAAPGVSAAALVVVAAGLALGLVGRVARWFSLLVVVAGGLVIAGSGFNFIRSPEAAARSGVAEATGVIGVVGDVSVSYAPYLAVVCGLAIIAVAVRATLAPIDWGSRTTKYDTPGHGGGAHSAGMHGAAVHPDAHDGAPTSRDAAVLAASAASTASTAGDTAAADPSAAGVAGSPPEADAADDQDETVLDERDAWDALTQGDDPT